MMDCGPFSAILGWVGYWAMLAGLILAAVVIVALVIERNRFLRASEQEPATAAEPEGTSSTAHR